MNNNDFQKMMQVKNLQKGNRDLKFQLAKMKRVCIEILGQINDIENKAQTDQYALFSMTDGKYQFQRIVDIALEEEYSDEAMADTALIMRLPHHETLKEFDGF